MLQQKFDIQSHRMMNEIFPEPTARSAVPGVSPGQGLLISLLGSKSKVVVHGRR